MSTALKRLYEIYPSSPKSVQPLGLRVNDTIFAQSLSAADPVTGESSGDIKQQTAKALHQLKDLIERAGGSLDNVARGVGFCTTVEDRGPVDEVWMEMFPDANDKPAMKVLLAELPPGQLVRIDALALLGQSRERIDIPNVRAHDPTVKIGNWVISSRCHGNDQATGQVVPGGLEAEARQTLENLATLMKLAGGSEDDIIQLTTFGRDASYLPVARRVFEERFPDPGKRPALNQVVNFVAGQMQITMEMIAVVGASTQAGTAEAFQELYLDVEHNSLPAAAKVGPLVVAPCILPVYPASQQVVPGEMEEQLRAVFQNMDAVLEAAGCSRHDVGRVTLFMRQVSDRTAMNKVYKEWYPDEATRPPHKYVPAELPEGIQVAAQVIAVPGGRVRDLEIEGIHHQDYMSLGGLCGNLVASSRIFGTDPATGKGSQDPDEHTAIVLDNAERLLKLAGGSWQDLQQATFFYWGDEMRPTIEKHWQQRLAGAATEPQLNLIETALGGQNRSGVMLPRLEIVALL